MPPVSILIKPASGNCNMRCAYCFYYDTMSKREQFSYGYMSEEVLECVIQKALAYAEGSCTFAFQGGEPTLVGLPFYEKVIQLQEKYNKKNLKVYNSLQTNGYGLTKQWATFFKQNHFLVGVSLDGGPKIQNCYRKNVQGEPSFDRVMRNIELLSQNEVSFNILSVMTGKSAPLIKKTYQFYRKNHLNYLQFIACLEPLGEVPGRREFSLLPEVYGRFLIELFDLWYEDWKAGKQPYIRQFENYVGILLGYQPESCDMNGRCGMQYVVEADGAVYPCDFYVTDEYRLGSLVTDSFEDIDSQRKKIKFVEESEQKSEKCKTCQYQKLCRGGCRRTRLPEMGHQQYFCEAYRMFFDARLSQMTEIALRVQEIQ